ncbi:SpoIIE family protein phosphatase [Desulfonatronum thioautotrophicum]|uniref:SpoIIE family protein phosphatase n=1 Tax=Desulfonatronum thioautotrophicum TaxID=617001 RepID=UPI0005EB72A7|nr:SpoIIE family protein phosphatase [Desulfonatronum thioautotrophicum]
MPPGPSPSRKQRLSFRLALFILTSTTLVFLTAFGYNYQYSKRLVLKNVQENAANLTRSLVHQLDTTLSGVERIPRYLALRLERDQFSETELLAMLRDVIDAHQDIYGTTIAFEPYGMNPDERYHAPYVYRDKTGKLVFTSLGGESYHYFRWEWYSKPRQLGRPAWSEPYFDEGGGNVVMSTFSAPFYRQTAQGSQFHGVVTADIFLEDLVKIISAVSLYETGYAFLISRTGQFVAHPDQHRIMRESVFSVAEEMNLPELSQIGRKMIQGREGFAEFTSVHTGQVSLLTFAPVPSSGWSVGVIIPKNELYADIHSLNNIVLLIGATGFLILLLMVVAISRSITRPLRSLVGATTEIAKGNLDVALPRIRVNDEVGQLSDSVGAMRMALKEYITNLTETTKAKERIESELKIARNIQMNFLPKRFPPFPDRHEMDVFAVLDSAKHVGGDLYDFFLLDEDHLFFSVGDVSDKGVPAALFMAVTKTLVKGIAEQETDPHNVLARVNNELCRDNDSGMFVTLFCAVLNLRTGLLRYSNAGHNKPILVSENKPPQWLDLPPGLVLGGMEDVPFQTREIRLNPGDLLLAYTDGVTEAMNPELTLYTEGRLLEEVRVRSGTSPKVLVEELLESVRAFSCNAPQSDDITLLALLFIGASENKTNS